MPPRVNASSRKPEKNTPAALPETTSTATPASRPLLVTVEQIQAAAEQVTNPKNGRKRMALLAGHSASSLADLKTVVRRLAKAKRLHPDAVAMLAEAEADDMRALLAASDDSPAREAVVESLLADFEHTVETGEEGSENAGQERDIYVSAWRSPKAATAEQE